MEPETSVILGRSTTATLGARGMTVEAMAPSRTSRTESTAVFIGRASFQMIPAVYAAQAREDRAEAAAPVVATPAPAVILVEERLTPGPVPQDLMTQAETPTGHESSDGIPAGAVMRLFSAADVTEPIQARPRVARPRRRLINARTVRTVLLALTAGATITLSAEAVMRRPAAITSRRAQVPSAPPPVDVAVPPIAAPAPAPLAATVVASTVNDPRPEPVADAVPAPAPARATPKRGRARSAPATRRPSAIAGPAGVKTSATWVDPFAAEETSAPAPKRAATAWVDPFVN